MSVFTDKNTSYTEWKKITFIYYHWNYSPPGRSRSLRVFEGHLRYHAQIFLLQQKKKKKKKILELRKCILIMFGFVFIRLWVVARGDTKWKITRSQNNFRLSNLINSDIAFITCSSENCSYNRHERANYRRKKKYDDRVAIRSDSQFIFLFEN